MKMKKLFLLLIAALFLGIAPASLTSCSHDEPELSEEEKMKQAMEKLLEQQILALDLSEMMEGETSVGMWALSPDSTFVYFHVGGLDNGVSADDWTIDTLEGTWSKFDEKNPWNGEQKTLSGFRAAFNLDGREDAGSLMATEDYYFVSEEDSVQLVLSKGAMEYVAMYGVDEEDIEASAAVLSAPRTRILIELLITWILYDPETVVERATDAYKWVVNTLGVDVSSYNLDEDASKKFEENLSKKLWELQSGANTDYGRWMKQTFVRYGRKDVRLCEMNIPGTHDSFTYYMSSEGVVASTVSKYARTQSLSIEGQWNAGVRCFDVRFKTMPAYMIKPTILFDPKWWLGIDNTKPQLGMYHQDIFCGITAKAGIQEIVKMLQQNPTETAILFCAFEGSHGESDYKLARELMDEFSDYIVQNPTPDMTLRDCAGKMVIFQAWDRANNYPSTRIGPFFGTGDDEYNDHGYIQFYNMPGEPKTRLLYQNRYQSGTTDFCTSFWNEKRDLMTKCFTDANNTSGSSDNVWSVNQASGYVGGQWIHMSYTKNSNAMNPWTANYVIEHKNEKLGIVQMDFAGKSEGVDFDGYCTNSADLPKIIVETNRCRFCVITD